jgi:hypothetical protein
MARASKQRFEGKTVSEVRNRVIGQVGDARLNTTLAPDTEVVVVVSGVVEHVEHDRRKKGLIRIQRISVGEGYVLTEGIDADDLLMKLRADRQAQLDELLGTPPLDFPDGEGPKDGDDS